MKNLKLLLVFVPLFTIACSDEYLSENTENAQTLNDLDKANNHAMQRKRKDKDWETAVTKIPKTVLENQDITSGVKMAEKVEICQKQSTGE